MNDYLPYEDEVTKRLRELHLPGEDNAWEDMRRRLDDDDNRRPFLLPVFRGCGLIAMVVLILIVAGVLIIAPRKQTTQRNSKNERSVQKGSDSDKFEEKNTIPQQPLFQDSSITNSANTNKTIVDSTFIHSYNNNMDSIYTAPIPLPHSSGQQNILVKKGSQTIRVTSAGVDGNTEYKHTQQLNRKSKNVTKPTVKNHIPGNSKNDENGSNAVADEDVADSNFQEERTKAQSGQPNHPLVNNILPGKKVATDTIKAMINDTTIEVAKAITDTAKKKKLYLSAGIGLQQLIPVAGQQTNPYNSQGRKGSLGDYIPSIYFRLHKNKKWFIQSEFRYGAPQYTKNILFKQQQIRDSSGNRITSTGTRLKKTFYHQLPVSFHYFIRPGLSVGTGISINKFNAAIVDREVRLAVGSSGIDTLLSKQISSEKRADTNLVNTYLQAFIETQYQWKRLSGGIKYSFGLQPYVKFNLSGSNPQKEKNSSLQIFIRYQLWPRLSGKK